MEWIYTDFNSAVTGGFEIGNQSPLVSLKAAMLRKLSHHTVQPLSPDLACPTTLKKSVLIRGNSFDPCLVIKTLFLSTINEGFCGVKRIFQPDTEKLGNQSHNH